MDGLIIKSYWAKKILMSKKRWEIRGSDTKHRGTHFIIESGTGLVIGKVDIIDSFQIDLSMFRKYRKAHQIADSKRNAISKWNDISYKKKYAWELKNPILFATPIKYKHPQGAVIWVKNVENIMME